MGYLEKLPGISDESTTRRKVLVSSGYAVVGLAGIGAAAGPQDDGGTDAGGSVGGDGGDSGGSSGGDSDGGSGGESYADAFAYDESTGIVLEDDIEAEADSIGSLYIRGTARNESGGSYEYVQLTWSVLDSSGVKVADALANTSGLEEGQSWRYEALAPSAENADSYELQDIEAY